MIYYPYQKYTVISNRIFYFELLKQTDLKWTLILMSFLSREFLKTEFYLHLLLLIIRI